MTTMMTKDAHYHAAVAHIEALHAAAALGSNERLQWEIVLRSMSAARSMGEGDLRSGLNQARTATEMFAGH